MAIDLPSQYDPKSVEQSIYDKWISTKAFHAVPDERKARFSMVIPPPNVTGALHLGHAINGTIQDILTRYHRMRGDNTLWMPGIDHAGIATQAVVERTIFEKEKKTRHDLGREELVRRIWEWKEQYGNRILSQQAKLGASCDWERVRFTLDEVCAKAVRTAFFKMFRDGLIFRGKRLVNWDTHLQTAVADDEIYYETVKGQMTSIKYPVDGREGEYLIVATTRPETMLGDTAVAVHPDDPRYTHLHGKQVIIPLVGRKIPVICDGQLVDPKFGTGVVKVTPAHDPNDYATGQRHNLEMINLLTPDGKVNENGAGEFLGKKYSYTGLAFATVARKQVIADLEALGLIADVKVHEHEVGHSDRSKTPIEPYLSDQWFVRMGDIAEMKDDAGNLLHAGGITLADGTKKSGLAQAAMDAVVDGRVKITPERYAKGYLDWLGQKRDWCISRQLWWGHRIPVWTKHADDTSIKFLFEKIDRKNAAGEDVLQLRADLQEYVAGEVTEVPGTDDDFPTLKLWVCVAPGHTDFERHLEALGFVQDPDVLDTWFSSALWPISTMGWPNDGTTDKAEDKLLPYFYPTSVLSTARDILTLWVARMVMFGLYGRGDVPFRNVYVHAVIQDGEGRTMSKTKGNGVDPVDVINSHGADALRFTLAQMATETQDIRMPVQIICPHCNERFPNPSSHHAVINCPKCKKAITRSIGHATATDDAPLGHTTSDRFDIGRNFANKIWNASRYILGNIKEDTQAVIPAGDKLELADRWILSRLNTTIATVEDAINGFRFSDVATALYQFFWSDLCDWYLEISKARIKAGDAVVQNVLLHCMETCLKLLHPVMPFISEAIWEKLPNRTTMLVKTPWPKATPINGESNDAAAEMQIAMVQSVTSAIREVQNRYPAAKGKDVIIKPRDEKIQQVIEQGRLIIEALANATIAGNSPAAAKPANAATSVLADAEVYIAGVIDKDAETAKLTKRKAELEKFIASGRAKLANQAAVAKVPEKVVQGWRDQLAKQEAEFAAIEKNLAELQ